ERFHGASHGQQAGLQDVEFVDLRHRGTTEGVTQGVAQDAVVELLTPGRCQLLRICQARNRSRGVENDGRRHHIAGQRATSDLVDTGDKHHRINFNFKLQLIVFHSILSTDSAARPLASPRSSSWIRRYSACSAVWLSPGSSRLLMRLSSASGVTWSCTSSSTRAWPESRLGSEKRGTFTIREMIWKDSQAMR